MWLNVCFIIYYKEDKFKKNINYIFEKKIVLRFIISSIKLINIILFDVLWVYSVYLI